jgi:hypothetical protein
MFNVNEIIARTSLHEMVEKAGGKIHKSHSACPIHGGDNVRGFHIYHKDGKDMWTCFSGSCGGGDIIDFIQAWRGVDFKTACDFLGGDVHSDPIEMERLARVRVENAARELLEKQQRYDAALSELRFAEKHLHYHNTMGDWAKVMWAERGLDEGMQSFFTLGACDDFTINDGYHTPTLTIPILGEPRQLLNIQHRLVNPPNPKDKYRPERMGLGSPPFLAIPEMGFDGGLIIVVEGSVKAAVTWANLNESDIQAIGVAGRVNFKKLADPLRGKNVVVIPDPGADADAYSFAKSIRARYLPMGAKVDDYILETGINANQLFSMIRQARRVS